MAASKSKQLPQRPKSHITGERAVLALRNSLPQHWIFRESTSDYGIDCEIEIATTTGDVTGAVVKGQVKGTSSNIMATKKGIAVTAQSIRYWLALPVPVIIVRVTENPQRVYWLDVREYLLLKNRLDSVYTSQQDSFYFNFRNAFLLPNDSAHMDQLAVVHQECVKHMRVTTEEDVGGQFVGYVVMVQLFDGDPDKWIQWLRENGGKDQLLADLPFAFWVKEQSEQDPDFLNRVYQMVEEAT